MSKESGLNEAQIESFNERGYLKVDFGLDPALLDTIVARVNSRYGQEAGERHPGTRAQDAWLQVDEIRRLAVDERIRTALAQLYGRQALPFQTLNFPVGTTQLAHSDTIHFNCIPRGYMAGVWVALEDIDGDNGPLVYYPGSHKLPEYSMRDLGLKPGYEHYLQYEQKIQELIAKEGLEPEYGTMHKGGALIWHGNLLHGGAPRNDPARSRHSQVTHYYFAGCKYYTPMLSSSWRRRYRKPVWIPDTAHHDTPEDSPLPPSRRERLRMRFNRFKRRMGLG